MPHSAAENLDARFTGSISVSAPKKKTCTVQLCRDPTLRTTVISASGVGRNKIGRLLLFTTRVRSRHTARLGVRGILQDDPKAMRIAR